MNGTFDDPCGPDFNLKFKAAVTEGVEYTQTRTGNTITVTAKVTDSAKYVLTNPTWSQTATDKLEACPVEKLVGLGFKTGCGVVDVTNPAKNPGVFFQYGSFNEFSPDGEVFIEPGQTVRVNTNRARLDWAAFDFWGDYEPIFGEGLKVPQKCGPKKPPSQDRPDTWKDKKPSSGAPSEDDGDDPGIQPAVVPSTPVSPVNWLLVGALTFVATALGAGGRLLLKRQ